MATWLAHLRVAELISAELRATWLSEPDFLAGSVAPDCGIPVPGGFDPPKEVTHWTQRGKGHCDYERFYREMIAGKSHDPHTLSFLLGYYCHLMADVLWVRRVNDPCKELHRELYAVDRAEYYRQVKPEWYANDHLYLREHPDCRVFRKFCKIADYPVNCLHYYGSDYVERQIRNIQQFYLNPPEFSTDLLPHAAGNAGMGRALRAGHRRAGILAAAFYLRISEQNPRFSPGVLLMRFYIQEGYEEC